MACALIMSFKWRGIFYFESLPLAASRDFMGFLKSSRGLERFMGSCGHATCVQPHRNTHGFLEKRFMPVPMQFHTARVCDSIGSA